MVAESLRVLNQITVLVEEGMWIKRLESMRIYSPEVSALSRQAQ